MREEVVGWREQERGGGKRAIWAGSPGSLTFLDLFLYRRKSTTMTITRTTTTPTRTATPTPPYRATSEGTRKEWVKCAVVCADSVWFLTGSLFLCRLWF